MNASSFEAGWSQWGSPRNHRAPLGADYDEAAFERGFQAARKGFPKDPNYVPNRAVFGSYGEVRAAVERHIGPHNIDYLMRHRTPQQLADAIDALAAQQERGELTEEGFYPLFSGDAAGASADARRIREYAVAHPRNSYENTNA